MTATTMDPEELAIDQREDHIEEIHRRAQRWRLMDCNQPTLVRMRASLNAELASLEERLASADDLFAQYVGVGNPTGAEQTQETINRLSGEWERLRKRLKEVEEALRERRLRRRLINLLGSEARVNMLDGLVFLSILIVVVMTLAEMLYAFPDQVVQIITIVDTAICIFLIGDFFLRLSLSGDVRWYFRNYWIDLVSSIPFYGILRFGRLVRIARFARLLRLLRLSRALRLLLFIFRGLDKLLKTFEINLLKRSVLIALILLVVGALSINALEGAQAQSISDLGESLWWSFSTVVTGGFADLYNPTTSTGRIVTVGMILLGLTVTGIFTASLTSVLVEDESSRLEQNQHRFEERLGAISHKLDLLTGETNQAMVALETLAQAVSNQTSREALAETLVTSLTGEFRCLQASIHLLDGCDRGLARIAQAGLESIAPPARLALGEGWVGSVSEELQALDMTEVDLEPQTDICLEVQGKAMICPLAAGCRFMGVLHLVLPLHLASDYLYTRIPMTLAHQAALAFHALAHAG